MKDLKNVKVTPYFWIQVGFWIAMGFSLFMVAQQIMLKIITSLFF